MLICLTILFQHPALCQTVGSAQFCLVNMTLNSRCPNEVQGDQTLGSLEGLCREA